MDLNNFDYELPKELITQIPLHKRDESKLLIYNRKENRIEHKKFYNIIDYFNSGDILVFNDTKVFHSRLYGRRKSGGKVEVLLLREEDEFWKCLIRSRAHLKVGEEILFNDNLCANIVIKYDDGSYDLKFNNQLDFETINRIGKIPLPPYIKRPPDLSDETNYQTVYAKHFGSAAAPTAGFHFTEELLKKISAKNIEFAFITLHISWATFKPIKDKDITKHKMHSEWYEISNKTAEKINTCSGKLIVVGTSTARVLEAVATKYNKLTGDSGFTDFYIYPGYKFKVVQALITNFHLPKSTLLVLISAFIGIDKTKEIYKIAIANRYRFLSYGDAMLIL